MTDSSRDDSHTAMHEASVVCPRAVIVTGYSGSGKSTVINALEDIGFYCIDNMPVPLLAQSLDLIADEREEALDFAFVVDARERKFLAEANNAIEHLQERGTEVEILFLEAEEEVLLRRFSATRRRHPTSDGGTVREGIEKEKELLAHLRARAGWVVDTSNHTVHTLKALVQDRYSADEHRERMRITLLTFGFKHGLPPECDLVFDLRFVPNPYFVEELREQTGLDDPVRDYVLGSAEAGGFIYFFRQFSDFSLPLYQREGKAYLTIGLACTGGRHRSVAIAEAIGTRLRGQGWDVTMRHRDVEK